MKNFQNKKLKLETLSLTKSEKNIKRKAQISKRSLFGGSFSSWVCNLDNKTVTNFAISFSKDKVFRLVKNIVSNERSKFERKASGKEAVISEKGLNLFLLSENVNGIIKIIKSIDDFSVLIDVTETVQNEIKKLERGLLRALLRPLTASLGIIFIY